MNRRAILKNLALTAPTARLPGVVAGQNRRPLAPPASAPSAAGRFQPTQESLAQYQTPEWSPSGLNFEKKYANRDDLKRVWAPQATCDAKAKKYLVYFWLRHGAEPAKICCASANKDFADLTGALKQLFFPPPNGSCTDGDIVAKAGKCYLFFKTEGHGNGIEIAVSDQLTEGHVLRDKYVRQTPGPVEGAGTFKPSHPAAYVLPYDRYTSGKYQFARTRDLQNFTVVGQAVSLNFHPRPGPVLPLTAAEASRPAQPWMIPSDVLLTAQNPAPRKLNAVVSGAAGKVAFLAWPGTSPNAFDLQRYGTADPPPGKIAVPARSSVSSKDAAAGSYGTAHNPVIQVPGRDGWYLAYHRFTYPQGIKMGGYAGFHRAGCLHKAGV